MPNTKESKRGPLGHRSSGETQYAGPRRLGDVLAKAGEVHPSPSKVEHQRLGLVAFSPRMQEVVNLAWRAANVDTTVLITGETGVGKERIARLIHDHSLRAAGPFLAVNCAAITETLLESELFGHVRGAFTGAASDHTGLVEAARGGTLLLDEIGEMAPALQVKLLRVLQDREIRRVGEVKSRPVDIRFLAATHCNLANAMDKGLFRPDLYYRLKVIELRVPALRDRADDILPLARGFLADACRAMARPMAGMSERASHQIRRYDWPGNVRELENAMERGVALAAGNRLEVEDLPEEIWRTRTTGPRPLASTDDGVQSLAEVEKSHVLAVLRQNEGNRARTAEQLQIGTATLYRKLRRWKAAGCDRDGSQRTQ